MNDDGQKRQLPQWALIAAVLGSGALTAWAMWRTQAAGPESSWDRVESAVEQVWAQPPAPAPARSYTSTLGPAQTVAGAPMTAAATTAMTMSATPRASMVARVLGAPQIGWGASRPHGDRGSCTECHSVLRRHGRPVPMILSSASMPHAFRGICGNCHTVQGNGPVGPLPVAMPVPPTSTATAPTMGAPSPLGLPLPPPPVAQPQEVEWRGLETRAGGRGVTVSNVEGTARRAGVLPGDVIVSLNGAPVTSMARLAALTMNGDLAEGTIIVLRGGQRMAFELRQGPGVGIASPFPAGGSAAQPGFFQAQPPRMAGQ